MKKKIRKLQSFAAIILLIVMMPLTVKAQELELYAQSAVLMDGDTGRILFGKNESEVRAMASTTKIMTCILVLENTDLDDTAVASEHAAMQPKVHLGVWKGETFYVKDLLYSLMLESHNDAAVILAEKTAGSVEAFAEKMNQKAEEIGCSDTHFVMPNGLDAQDAGGEHRTTASDLARILCYCIKESPEKEKFLEITRTRTYAFSDTEQKQHYVCNNHNALLDQMEDALTGKTGFTGKAGYCYVGAVESEGRTFVVALLGCGWPNNRNYKWQDMRKITDYAKKHFYIREFDIKVQTPKILVENGVPQSGERNDFCQVATGLEKQRKESENDKFSQDGKIRLLLSDEDEVKLVCHMKTKTEAPLKKGSILGNLTLFLNKENIQQQNVVTLQSAERMNLPWCARYMLKKFLIS